MRKKSIVLAALSAAAVVSISGIDSSATATVAEPAQSISVAARESLLQRVSPARRAEDGERIAAKKKFKLFDNGPSFVKSVKPRTRA